jgi:hypothetical protein
MAVSERLCRWRWCFLKIAVRFALVVGRQGICCTGNHGEGNRSAIGIGVFQFFQGFVFFRSIAALMIFLIFSAILSNSAISESVKLSNTLRKVFEMQCEFDHQFAPSTELLSPFH